MAFINNRLGLIVLASALVIAEAAPLLEYPIVFEPINRGRLTIWSGISSLPASGFKCYAGKNGTSAILLDFSNFSDKLEWTYLDADRGTTFHGISVSNRENVVYKIQLANNQSEDHMDCNRVKSIETQGEDELFSNIKSACADCRGSVLALVNSQITELFRMRLNEQVIDGLHWHLSSLISSQHYSGPISL